MCIKIRASAGGQRQHFISSSEGAEYKFIERNLHQFILFEVLFEFLLSPFRAYLQRDRYTPGCTGGYSYLATLWLQNQKNQITTSYLKNKRYKAKYFTGNH
jgi:hypothetical protein